MAQLELIFLGQSGFLLQKGSSSLLIDPSKKKFGDVSGDVVFTTHYHSDHTNGIEIFLSRNPKAVLVCNEQVADRFKQWRDRIVLAVPGEEIIQGSWKLRFVKGRHGLLSKVQNTGVVVQTQGTSFGHTGDSVDFQGFSHESLDVFAIPIGGLFTASPKKALNELKSFSQPLPVVIPMHWLWRSPHRFCRKLRERYPKSHCIVPKDRESVPWQIENAP
ncbi:MAG: MBL fold metallo-hydrolase [Candidatus Heimdallarchaeota archaeon]